MLVIVVHMNQMFKICGITAVVVCLSALSLQAAVISVAPSGGDYTTLEAAVAAASDGDEIIIAAGNYVRTDVGLFVINKALNIHSAGGRDTVSIAGMGTGDRRGFSLNHPLARLAGITFRSFKSNVTGYPTGLEIVAGIVSDCVISNCTLNGGSAVKVLAGGVLEDSLVCDNTSSNGGVDRKGAGVYVDGGQVLNCEIRNNSSAVGAGMAIYGATARVANCHIHSNSQNGQILTSNGKTINGYGGGVFITAGVIEDSTIANNNSFRGAGIYAEGGIVRGCLVTNNTTIVENGAGIYAKGSTQIESSTIYRNKSMSPNGRELYMESGTATNILVHPGVDMIACAESAVFAAAAKVGSSALPVAVAGTGNLVLATEHLDWATLKPYTASPVAGMGAQAAYDAAAALPVVGASAVIGLAPLEVAFSGTMNDGTTASYLWDFGDGSTVVEGAAVTNTFVNPGIYQISLTATPEEGAPLAAGLTLRVLAATAYAAPGGGNIFPYDTVAKAATNVQDALEAVYATDLLQGTVNVAPGTYTYLKDASITAYAPMVVMDRNVRLVGQTVDGVGATLDADSKRQVLYMTHPAAILENVTLKKGRSNTSIMFNAANLILFDGVVTNCLITDGNANYAGNAAVLGGRLTGSRLTAGTLMISGPDRPAGGVNVSGTGLVEYCEIDNNSGGYGAGVYIGDGASGAVVRHCTIRDNYGASNGGGGVVAKAGLLDSCVIVSNTAPAHGGGAAIFGGTLRNSIIAWNRSTSTTLGTSSQKGGGAGVVVTAGNVQNCTIYGNLSSSSPAAHGLYQTGGTVQNTIISGNGGMDEIQKTGGTLQYCSVAVSGFDASNIVGDPALADPAAGDFSLLLGSGCIDSGTTLAAVTHDIVGTARPVGDGYDIGAYEADFGDQFVCAFAVDHNSGHDELHVKFTPFVTGGTAPYTYVWEVSDGSILRGAAPEKDFTCGLFDVTLTVTDSESRQASLTRRGVVKVSTSVLYADAASTNPVWPYASWETAAVVLQDAIDAAYYDDETIATVYVAVGEYKARSAGDLFVANVAGAIRLVGTNTTPVGTVINGEKKIRPLNLNHLRAFVANIHCDNGYLTAYTAGYSGGIWLYDGMVSNCLVTRCNGISAGGLTQYGGLFTDSVISNCINTTHTGGDRYGGGATIFGGTLQRTTITKCLNGRAGGIYVNGASSVVRDCRIVKNFSVLGGNVRLNQGLVENCLIEGNGQGWNTDTTTTLEYGGAGAYVTGSGSVLRNSLIVGNGITNKLATGCGGLVVTASAKTYNNTILGNRHQGSGSAPLDVRNDGGTVANTLAATLNTVSGTSEYNHIGVTDAGLRDIANGDYRLRSSSPCLNAGANSYWDGVIEPRDYLGNARFTNGRVDIGAFEFEGYLGSVILLR